MKFDIELPLDVYLKRIFMVTRFRLYNYGNEFLCSFIYKELLW